MKKGKLPHPKPEESPLRLGITIADNDFSHTLRPFMELMVSDGSRWSWQNLTKKQVKYLFELSAVGLYYLCQNRFQYRADTEEMIKKEEEHLRKYLTLDDNHIFLGDEVQKYYDHLMETQGYNYEFWFTMDGKTVHCL